MSTSELFQHKKVAILLTVFNGEKYIEETLKSILSQEYKNISIIVVDDGSQDGSSRILEKYIKTNNDLIRIVRHRQNLGATAALKTGFKNLKAEEEFVLTIAQDDLLPSNYITSGIQKFHAKDTSVLFSNLWIIDKIGRPDRRITAAANSGLLGKYQLAAVFSRNLINAPGAMIRTEHLESSFLDANYPYTHDMHLWMNLATKGKIRLFFGSFCFYRVHSSSITSNRNNSKLHEEISRSRFDFLNSKAFEEFIYKLNKKQKYIFFILIKLMTNNESNCKHKIAWSTKLRLLLEIHGKRISAEDNCQTYQPVRKLEILHEPWKNPKFTVIANYLFTSISTIKLIIKVFVSCVYRPSRERN